MELIEGVVDIVKGALEAAGNTVEVALENPYVRLDIVHDEIRNSILILDEASEGFIETGFVDVDKII